ncbi:hypothetical protein Tco_0824167 [Tanacetum coccineum]|uniref:Uncharacterized protein n=1 Tax=Tanacetum coccineum TaxID=301880 RepID=A0ABQ5AP17_9ASTR
MRAESARKHEELMDLLKNNAFSSGRAKEVEEWEKWRDLNKAQQASDDIISNPKSQIFAIEECDDGSRPEEHLVVPCSAEEIVKLPTQPEKIGEDGGHLEEFQDVLTGDEVDITGPLITVEDEPLMMLGSDPNTIKEDFSNDLDGQHSADKKPVLAQRRTDTEKNGEDSGNLEEFMVASDVEEAAITTPIMVVAEELGRKLIYDFGEADLMLGSEGESIESVSCDPPAGNKSVQKENIKSRITCEENCYQPYRRVVEQSHNMFGWHAMRLKRRRGVYLGHPETIFWFKQGSKRRVWDPGITGGDMLKQHLEDKVFLEAGKRKGYQYDGTTWANVHPDSVAGVPKN